jgi:MFS family permease
VLLALEYGHVGRRGFLASWPQVGVPLGLLTSTGVMAGCQGWLTPEAFQEWGWRVPFYLSGLLIVVGLLIRMRVLETPLFAALQKADKVAKSPVRETLRYHWREVLLAAGTRIAENSCFYLFTAWTIAYGRDVLEVEPGMMLLAVSSAAGLEIVAIPVFGALSDRWSRRWTYMAGCGFLFLFAVPFFALLETRQPEYIVLAIVVAVCVGHAPLYSVQAAMIPELFSTHLRCTGASLGYQLGAPTGGLAPLVAAVLIKTFPRQYWPLAAYVMLVSVISLACVQRLAETSRKDLKS